MALSPVAHYCRLGTHSDSTKNSHSFEYLPPIRVSAIALGTAFNHAANLAVLTPLFGETYRRAQHADSKEEFIKRKEAASAAVLYGTTLVGSGIQTYAVAAVLNHLGIMSYKGAAYVGGLLFAATSVPQVCSPSIHQQSTQPPILTKRCTVGFADLPGAQARRDGCRQGRRQPG
jgi:hypothetical protein